MENNFKNYYLVINKDEVTAVYDSSSIDYSGEIFDQSNVDNITLFAINELIEDGQALRGLVKCFEGVIDSIHEASCELDEFDGEDGEYMDYVIVGAIKTLAEKYGLKIEE